MQEKINHLPECEEGTEQFCWNGYSFPRLPALIYQADGPDKHCPDRLFIVDRQERFRFYFERDGEDLCDTVSRNPDWETLVVQNRRKRLQLCYPLQVHDRKPSAGYFRMDFLEERDSCTGSLSIALPEPYFEGLRKFTELHQLFRGLQAGNRKGGDAHE